MRQPVSHAKHNETHMSELLYRRQRLRKRKKRNIILNTVCILLVLCAIVWTVDYFWRYFKYETTNDAVIDQYISPVGIRVSGYIKEVRFTEHQPVKAGDTLLVLDDREYRIRLKDAEAALMDARASKTVLGAGIAASEGRGCGNWNRTTGAMKTCCAKNRFPGNSTNRPKPTTKR